MKATSATYKQIIASGASRKFVSKIDLTLADNTVLHLTGEDIWEDSFAIETASSGTSTFDIGTAVIGKCKFTINNINGDFDGYDFFNANAVVWEGLKGDEYNDAQIYHRMGFYTVDEPDKACGLISLTLLDNMWKFDVPFSGVNVTYPVTALSLVQTLCTYCGVQLAASSANFHGYNFSIAEEPNNTDNMNCREVLQYVAMLGCNFCIINDQGQLEIKWYDSTAINTFDYNKNTSFGTDEIEITGVKFVIDNTAYSIGTTGYVLELENPLVTASNVNSVLNLIWDVLHANNQNFTLRTFNATVASDLAVEVGDVAKIQDYQGNYIYSWVTLNSFKLAGHQIQCNAQPPNRQLVTRYSKTVQAAVEVARQQTNQIISNYDLAVQEFNKLVEQAMGAYTDYEDAPTGGRYYYISNMPITKSAQGVCSFQPNSIVYKMAGDVFSISRDGGITWVNGYDPTTGELIVNVLDAIGINFDWARGGTLTLGGYGNGNGVLSIQDATNVEKVHGDNVGIKVGATTGSKIFINTDGELQYFYDNAYMGKIRMRPNVIEGQTVDMLRFEDFDYVRVGADKEVIIHGDDEAWLSGQNVALGTTMFPLIDPNERQVTVDAENVQINAYDDLYFQFGTLHGLSDEYWHTWAGQQQGTWVSTIVLGVGVTQAVFPDINRNYAYDPYIQCADGVDAPLLEGISYSGTNCTVTFTAVTAAQAGSGGDSCVIRLLTKVIRNN